MRATGRALGWRLEGRDRRHSSKSICFVTGESRREGFWDGKWRVLFEFGPQRENGEMEVTYRWEEMPGRPMNERRYVGYFSHGDVHLEPQRNTRRKKKITLVKVYPSDGETAIFAVGKFGKSRMTMLSPVPATAQQE